MAKNFNTSLGQWLEDNISVMSQSAEMRADIHETIMDLGAETEVSDQQAKLILSVLQCYISLYHICDRNPKSFSALLEILNPKIENKDE
ncbi:hypothetical protein [Elizabethkingia anophelis]|uniref:hypothetical protein n=1 Tax=Elizabethkingia anophelis TaxID=1117645 RepID=UPI000442B8CE|nr:hypothetical protein [Elizabethkingia anophelis]CDN79549.1 hypothetical protein E27107_60123 [Elizabethkingia anophelis]